MSTPYERDIPKYYQILTIAVCMVCTMRLAVVLSPQQGVPYYAACHPGQSARRAGQRHQYVGWIVVPIGASTASRK
jgi:hypothetical protein